MKTFRLFLVLLFVASPAFAQKSEKQKIYEAVDNILTAKSYERMLQFVDVVNGVVINGAGKISRFVDDAVKNRTLYKENAVMSIPPMENVVIVVDKNVAIVNIESQLVQLATLGSTQTQATSFRNSLLFFRLKGEWKVQEWIQIQLSDETKPKPERKEWR